MSFISAMKRAFGFQTEESVDEDLIMDQTAPDIHYRDASVVPLKELHQQEVQERPAGEKLSPEPVEKKNDDAQDSELLEIFDGVLTIFNEAQPQFIRDCLDRDAQRRYLYTALRSSVDNYISNLSKEARDKALDMDRKEREQLQADVAALREKEKMAEQAIAEQQTKNLSAQRQKRALTQRIEDSEKKIAELEAEKEQSDLQIRSLVNKLKVAEVKGGDSLAQQDEIEGLRNDVSAKNAENSRLSILLEQQRTEITELKKSLEQTREQLSEAQSMQMTEEDRRLIQDVQDEMAKFEEIKTSKDAKIAALKKQVAELNGQVSAQTSQLDGAAARTAELEAQLAALQAMLQDLQSNSALNQSLMAREDMMSKDAKQDKVASPDEKPVQEEAAAAPKRTRSRRKPKVSAIDENIESVNWLLTVPSDENPAPSVGPAAPDADFGYQPPVKKEIASNDAQLTLF